MTPSQRASEYLKQQIAASGLSKKNWYWQVYLKSDHWSDLRKEALANAKFKCSKCECGGNLDVHHERYKSIYNVTQDDLSVLCRKCHNAEHEGKKDIRQANRKPRKPKAQPKKQKSGISSKKSKVQCRKLAQAYKRGKKEAGGTQIHRVTGGYASICQIVPGLGELSESAKAYIAKIKRELDSLKSLEKSSSKDPIVNIANKIKGMF